MNETTTDGLKLGAGLIMAIVLIGAVITVLMIGVGFIQKGGGQASEMAQNFGDKSITQYDNQIVTGDTINSLIAQHAGEELGIVVNTAGGEVFFGWKLSAHDGAAGTGKLDTETIPAAEIKTATRETTNRTNDKYIAPTNKYYATVLKDPDTTAVIGLYFEPVASVTP